MAPPVDHSYNDGSGHYFVSAFNNQTEQSYARLISPLYPGGPVCLKFWYHFVGGLNTSATLNVYKRPGEGTQIETPALWTLTNNHNFANQIWLAAEVSVDSEIPFNLVFESVTNNNASAIAIDDISRKEECSSTSLGCDFEVDTCLWTNFYSDDVDYILGMGQVLDGIGPGIDHTLGSPFGKYLYIENDNSIEGVGLFVSSMVQQEYACFSFWSWIEGDGIELSLSSLEVTNDINMQQLWHGSTQQNPHWASVSVSIDISQLNFTSGSNFKLLFEALLLQNPDSSDISVIALDDFSVTDGVCGEPTPTPTSYPCEIQCDGLCISSDQICDYVNDCENGEDEPKSCGYNCNFEGGTEDEIEICSYKADVASSWIWQHMKSGNNLDLGPKEDHTFLSEGQGHYFALGYNEIEQSAHYAKLMTPKLPFASSKCKLNFWYHMNGPSNATKADYAEFMVCYNIIGVGAACPIYYGGNRGDGWRTETVAIGRIPKPFQVKFQGHLSSLTFTHIALDDILFEDCELPPILPDPSKCNPAMDFDCTRHTCISQDLLCDFNDDCGDFSDEMEETAKCDQYVGRCDFEQGSTCDWTPVSTGSNKTNQWNIGSGQTETPSTGPNRDHTTNVNSGSYIYIDATNQNIAQIKSPIVFWDPNIINPTGGKQLPCLLRFHYYMFGKDVDRLRVFSRTTQDGPWDVVWQHEGEVGKYWERAEVLVRDYYHIQYIIQAEANNDGDKGDIAIDDVSFSGSCLPYNGELPPYDPPTPTPPGPCREGEFTCLNGQCIMQEAVCDWRVDCTAGEDEYLCAECPFEPLEHGTCGWEDVSTGQYMWELTMGASFGAQGEWVMAVKPTLGEMSNEAIAEAPGPNNSGTHVLGEAPASCTVTFRYMKFGDEKKGEQILSLEVVNPDGGGEILWSQENKMPQEWFNETVGIGFRDRGWKIQMVGFKESENKNATMVFDDMHFINCTLPVPEECKEDEFQCKNGVCININSLCDFNNDCDDWSDEEFCSEYPGMCNFESDLCGYTQEKVTDDFDWIRRSGSTLSEGTGPDSDHTFGNETGYYLYIQASEAPMNSRARLNSQPFHPATEDDRCYFRLWFHMHGTDISELNVYLKDQGSSAMPVKLWGIKGEQEFAWLTHAVQIQWNHNWMVVVEALRSVGPMGDIAIDDLSFTKGCHPIQEMTTTTPGSTPTSGPNGDCTEEEFECLEDKTCISITEVCDFRSQCNDNSDEMNCPSACDFEGEPEQQGSLCHWREAEPDSLDWILAKGNDSSTGTALHGPYEPYHFGFLHPDPETTDFSAADATFTSPVFQNSYTKCILQFFFYLSGDIGKNIEVLSTDADPFSSNTITLGFINKDVIEEGVWKKYEFGIGEQANRFTVSFKREPAQTYDAGVALNAMEFFECAQPEPQESCEAHEYHCPINQVCILQDFVCNLANDCGDGSDEDPAYCAENGYLLFDFEKESGIADLFSQDQSDDFDWSIGQGVQDVVGISPTLDHTYFNSNGHYLFADRSGRDYSAVARLISKPLMASEKCVPRFFYHLNGQQVGTLTVYARNEDGNTVGEEFSISGDKGNTWRQGAVPAIKSQEPFEIVVEAIIGESKVGDIGLDDWTFTSGCSFYTGPWHGSTPTPEPTPTTPDSNNCTSTPTRTSPTKTTPSPTGSTSSATRSPPASTSTPSSPCDSGQFDCGTSCISAFYVCDGVNDCPNMADESSCSTHCDPGTYYCSGSCLLSSQQCDNIEDCKGGSDEALCGTCPDEFCTNNGQCQNNQRGLPICSCTDGFYGNRCELVTEKGGGDAGMWAAIAVIILIVVLASFAFLYYNIRNRINSGSTEPDSADLTKGNYGSFNDAFGSGADSENMRVQEFQMDDIKTSDKAALVEPSQTKKRKKHKNGPMSLENPLYGLDTSDA